MPEGIVRAARPDDAAAAARVHVEGWRETYRGLVADDILDNASGAGRVESGVRELRTARTTAPAEGVGVSAAE